MYKKIFVIYIIALLNIPTYGQDFIFRVMANKGENMFRPNEEISWKPIEKGVILNSGYWVKVAEDAYLGLLHNSGKTAGLKNPGVFEIEDIELSIKNQKKGLGSKYTEFVLNSPMEVSKQEEKPLVTRGDENFINVYLPNDSPVLGSTLMVDWEEFEEGSEYYVTFKGIFEDVLFEAETANTYLSVDLNREELRNETTFIVMVTLKGYDEIHSTEHAINRLSTNESRRFLTELSNFDSTSISALDHAVLASYFETNKLLIDASYHYQQALHMEEGVADFVELYQGFISRNKLGR